MVEVVHVRYVIAAARIGLARVWELTGQLDERTMLMRGSMTIDDANETPGTRVPQRDPRTGAKLTFALGSRPVPGERVEFDGVGLRVDAVEGLRMVQPSIVLSAGRPAERA